MYRSTQAMSTGALRPSRLMSVSLFLLTPLFLSTYSHTFWINSYSGTARWPCVFADVHTL